ncbi:MAG TPA: NosD domain-containing protein [candidate division Zixibacteria bacterium]|nr:NosD domain-containing protein [candidate division Zixibacteria bacterium]
MRRIVMWAFFVLLSTGMLMVAFNVGLARAQAPQTVFINSDGSVSPSSAPISNVGHNDTYTFYTLNGNISYPTYNGIIVERNKIIIDGNGYSVQGNNNGNLYDQSVGLNLTDMSNVLIENANIENFHNGIYLYDSNSNSITDDHATANEEGIYLDSSSHNTVSGNTATGQTSNASGIYLVYSNYDTVVGNNATANVVGIVLLSSNNNTVSDNSATANSVGIDFYSSSNNTVSGNDASANSGDGIYLDSSSNNKIYHNNFVNNKLQAANSNSTNVWDDGYPSGGNYWSDYNGTDFFSGPYRNVTGSDGISDTPYVVDANNTDEYPLMGGFSDFNDVGQGVDVQVVSNSTVSDFQFNWTAILFNVSGVNGTTGFCNVRIATSLLNPLNVFVNGTQVQYSLLPSSNSSISYLYFTYGHSSEQVIIVPEFPAPLNLAMFMLATLLAVAIYKKRHSRS